MRTIGILVFICCAILLGRSTSIDQVPASGKIIVGEDEYEMRTRAYSSDGKKVKIHSVEPTSVQEAVKDFETLTMEQGTEVEIEIEESPVLTVFEWDEKAEKKEIPLEDNKITIPSNLGVYIYEVQAEWTDGEAFFVFDVEVE